MKTDELKLRIKKGLISLIDIYFAENTFIDMMINSTLKVLLETNMDKIESFLQLFARDGEVDAEMIVNAYANQLSEDGVHFDLKQFINNDYLRSLIPNKSLLINKDDILNIIK